LEDLYEIHGRLLNEDELKRLQGLQQSLLSLSGHIFFEIKDFLENVYPGKVSHIGAPYEADHHGFDTDGCDAEMLIYVYFHTVVIKAL